MTELPAALKEWIARKHTRSCFREPGTLRADDPGCNATCTCDQYTNLDELRTRARKLHDRFGHLGNHDACQSPHDVLCKAVWS